MTTARMWLNKTKQYVNNKQIDIPVATHCAAELLNSLAIDIVARMKPVLGKTIAHQPRWKYLGGELIVATKAMPNHQRDNAHRKTAPIMAKVLIKKTSMKPSISRSKESGRPFAIPMKARAVKAGGPTFMKSPGRCSRFGRPVPLLATLRLP